MKNLNYFVLFSIVCFGILFTCTKKEPQKEIRLDDRIFDEANLLTGDEEQNIFDVIVELEKNVGSQIAIYIMNSLDGETIEAFASTKIEELKLGREKIKDGLLIVVAFKEAELRIEVGYGLERIIKDEIAAKIIREDMVPKFKKNEFYDGIYNAVAKMKELIEENESLVGKMRKRY